MTDWALVAAGYVIGLAVWLVLLLRAWSSR